jgi:hypothetical protein
VPNPIVLDKIGEPKVFASNVLHEAERSSLYGERKLAYYAVRAKTNMPTIDEEN